VRPLPGNLVKPLERFVPAAAEPATNPDCHPEPQRRRGTSQLRGERLLTTRGLRSKRLGVRTRSLRVRGPSAVFAASG
jgi:hypothetical protein